MLYEESAGTFRAGEVTQNQVIGMTEEADPWIGLFFLWVVGKEWREREFRLSDRKSPPFAEKKNAKDGAPSSFFVE